MGPGIIIPLVVLVVVIPVAFTSAKRYFKDGARNQPDEPAIAPSVLLTSKALRDLPTPPWRVVYEIAEDRLGGPGHVLIGPPGVFAVVTTMEPVPSAPDESPDAKAVANAAIMRGGLDDALRSCGMTSDRLLRVHWGAPTDGSPIEMDPLPGVTAVDGRSIVEWADIATNGQHGDRLSNAQVDLAWQTVTTAIGRPDPLA
ncbi:MAG: hypothetical protein ACO225_08680 [Ilumatobacteraceae bacterium]